MLSVFCYDINMYVYIRVCVCLRVYNYMHLYMCIYICMYIYTFSFEMGFPCNFLLFPLDWDFLIDLEYVPAKEWRNRTVVEHACSKMQILCITKTKWVE